MRGITRVISVRLRNKTERSPKLDQHAPAALTFGSSLRSFQSGRYSNDGGPALGAGAQLAIATDLRVATPDSVLGIPAAKLGLVVDHWTIRRLASEFSPPIARAMLLAAHTYTAEQLHVTGGVHRLGDSMMQSPGRTSSPGWPR